MKKHNYCIEYVLLILPKAKDELALLTIELECPGQESLRSLE